MRTFVLTAKELDAIIRVAKEQERNAMIKMYISELARASKREARNGKLKENVE